MSSRIFFLIILKTISKYIDDGGHLAKIWPKLIEKMTKVCGIQYPEY